MRLDQRIIETWIEPNSRILDLGCGDGTLLKHLADHKNVCGYGVEINADGIQACVEKGVNVIEQNLDEGLHNFSDNSFDTVILSQTLQTMRYPDKLLQETARVGRQVIVAIPNFGHWKARLHLMFKGRMPVSDLLPYEWYNTPNIHFCTFHDFEVLCRDQRLTLVKQAVVVEKSPMRAFCKINPNLFAETGLFLVRR